MIMEANLGYCDMLKSLLLGVAGLFIASTAVAGGGCGVGTHSAEASKPTQTVVSEDGQQTKGSTATSKDIKG
jgi:hypothetical protein